MIIFIKKVLLCLVNFTTVLPAAPKAIGRHNQGETMIGMKTRVVTGVASAALVTLMGAGTAHATAGPPPPQPPIQKTITSATGGAGGAGGSGGYGGWAGSSESVSTLNGNQVLTNKSRSSGGNSESRGGDANANGGDGGSGGDGTAKTKSK